MVKTVASKGSSTTNLDENQVLKASRAMLVVHQRATSSSKKQKLVPSPGESMLVVQFALRKIPERISAKPIRMQVPHSLIRDAEGCDMCLFVKDGTEKDVRERLRKMPVKGLNEVMSLDRLRREYKEFKDRRELLSQYDLFLCDDRILPMMTKALGKAFFKVKKHPVALRMNKTGNMKTQIESICNDAILHMSHGCCWAMKIATVDMGADRITANIMVGVHNAVNHIPGKWKNVQAIHLHSSTSGVSLPIYQSFSVTTQGDIQKVDKKRLTSTAQRADGKKGDDRQSPEMQDEPVTKRKLKHSTALQSQLKELTAKKRKQKQ
eukprot:238729_1